MELEHQFTVPVPVAQAWEVLLDVERIAPCMPGATVESFDGETIVGRVKVKVGPIQVTYAGTARFSEKDESARRAVIEANAKEARGSGTANATITAQLQDDGGSSTDVTVTTDLAITGKPAQFGRGVMVEVGNKLLGRFADCLAGELGSSDTGTGSAAVASDVAASTTGTPAPQARPAPTPAAASSPKPSPAPTPIRRADSEAIDLLDTAGLPVLKRLAPVLIGLIALLVFWRLVSKRRRATAVRR
jgi:carbon monoxide dehydrogenase subunit G